MEKIVVTRLIPENGLKLLKEHFSVHVNRSDRDLSQRELLKKLKDAFGVVAVLNNRFDRDLISRLDSLRVISDFAVGYNNVDVAAATEKGIAVTNTPGVLTDATADMTIGLLLAAARRIAEGDMFMRSGKFRGWSPLMMLGRELAGRTIGIVGAGRIGTAVAIRSLGFGLKVIYFSRSPNKVLDGLGCAFVEFPYLLSNSDFVSINVPLNEETRGMIGAKEIRLMKHDAILVNTARGEVVEEKALISALRRGRIGGAALDVYVNESHVNRELFKLKNVVLAPHLGSATFETRAKMSGMAALNAIAVLKGERPPSIVNPEVLADSKI